MRTADMTIQGLREKKPITDTTFGRVRKNFVFYHISALACDV